MYDFMTPPSDALIAPSGPVWLSDDGIVITVGSSESQDEETAKENMVFTIKATAGKPRPLLVDITKVKSMSKGAREEYVKQQGKAFITAVALVTNSNISRMIGNMFIRLNPPYVPVKMFTDPLKAKEWLIQYKVDDTEKASVISN